MTTIEFIERAEALGWAITKAPGGHLRLTHPRVRRVFFAPSTPSDWRSYFNALSQMKRLVSPGPKPKRAQAPRVRAKPKPVPVPKPKPELVVTSQPAKSPSSPPGKTPPRSAPVYERPRRRIAGGPAGFGNPWSKLW